jgi:Tol biopolymer transport system component
MKFKRAYVLLTLFCVLCAGSALALFDEYNHPELKWLDFETPHFVIYYTEGLEDVANMAAQIAEDIHEPLCTMYGYHPDTKVSLIFTDADDIANAATYFQSNKIHFYATSMAWDFRGTHNWLQNVVTHEYTHMIQLGASRKWSRHVPAIYGQFLGYEPERRPDVLYGYPNRLISWPIPSVTIPAWFAEGTAQFQFNGNGYDYWDSHRDMLLRQATLNNRLLSFEDMGYFGKSSLESEGVYNQGFALVKYIVAQTGDPDVLKRISKQMSGALPLSISAAMKRVTGKSGETWYEEWAVSLKQRYGALHDRLAPTLTKADTVPGGGFVNLFPKLSPTGARVAYISNEKRDYFGQTSLYIYSFDSSKAERVAEGAHGGLTWLPDGSGVIFTRQAVNARNGSLQHDLYLYLIEAKKQVPLSKGLRAEAVDLSPDGKTLVFTINEQGRREIAFAPMPSDVRKFKVITRERLLYRRPSLPHEQYYLPRWSPDGRHIAVARNREDGRSICVFDVADSAKGLTLRQEFGGPNLELRDPAWLPDGRALLLSWDVSGIPNVYRLNLADSTREPVTNVLGCALYPDARGTRLTYTDFCEKGFRICWTTYPAKNARHVLDTDLSAADSSYVKGIPPVRYNMTETRQAAKPYHPAFESLYWFPRVAFDYGTFKPGVYVLLNDFLDKLSFLGSFAVNEKKDYDLYGGVEYHEFYPTIFVDFYNIQRRLTSHFTDSTRIIGEEPGFAPVYDTYRIRYRYSLNELDAGVQIPLQEGTHLKLSGIYSRYVAHNLFDDGTNIGITYFRGWAGKFGLYTDQRRRGIVSQINPSAGYKAYLEYTRANHKFFTDLTIGGDVVGLKEIYAPYNYDLWESGIEKYIQLPGWKHTLEVRGHGGLITRHVDPFFYLYAGGLPGMRGYSFYSMGGERTAVGTLTYRFPIVERAGWNLWPLSVNHIYGDVFADVGDAWVGTLKTANLKKDIGAGLRVQLHSFYSYPTAIALDAAYGFDRFTILEAGRPTATYGREMRYYLTVLFDFYSPFAGSGGRTHSGRFQNE